MFDVFLDIIGVIVESLRRRPKVRAWTTGMTAALLAVAVILWSAAPVLFQVNNSSYSMYLQNFHK